MERKNNKIEGKEIYVSTKFRLPLGVEFFMAGTGQETNLSRDVAANPILVKEVKLRSKTLKNLQNNNREELFTDLTELINENPDNARIVLYLPFDVLPDLRKAPSEKAKTFASTYKEAWLRLLFESNIRADFNDGDVLEPGLGDPPRTRKAAHLLFVLLEKNIITQEEVLQILEINDNKELSQALIEGAIAARELNLFNDSEWSNLTFLAAKKGMESLLRASKADDREQDASNSVSIKAGFDSSMADIETKYSPDSNYVKNISKKRATWEKNVKIDELYEQVAIQLSGLLEKNIITSAEVMEFGPAGIRALVRFSEQLAREKSPVAKVFVESIEPILKDSLNSPTSSERVEAQTGIHHLSRFGLIQKGKIPDLASHSPIDLNKFFDGEGKVIAEAARKIAEDNELSMYLLPCILVFGSKIKGYADENGDVDMAIFIRPEIPFEKRAEVLALLSKKLPEFRNIDKVLEYWTTTENGNFGLREKPEDSSNLVLGSSQIHFLFGGAWVGSGEMDKLRTDLGQRYLNLERYGKSKDQVRSNHLRQLELDVLQYRLMHKGYKKYYPAIPRQELKNGKLIDWQSTFWDEGYRNLATGLFLTRVFLPDLS